MQYYKTWVNVVDHKVMKFGSSIVMEVIGEFQLFLRKDFINMKRIKKP